jgi:hypothetical protein
LEARESHVGKWKEQEEHHERVNEEHLKRGGAALIPEQGRGDQFVFSGKDRSFSRSVTLGVTLTLKISASECLAMA